MAVELTERTKGTDFPGGCVGSNPPGLVAGWPTMTASLLAYHGAISKQQCEELLNKKAKDGAYLIRDSETIQGAMCLCVYKQKVVYTYRLLQTHAGQYTLQAGSGVKELFFKTLEDLIQHYKRRGQGLAMHLRHSVKRKMVLQLHAAKLHDEEADYENLPTSPSDYVVVLPPDPSPPEAEV